ncbi:hypothetical protein [Streptomyces chartreusis]|uniref:hypothetical protein n=1 Tax=Streptomyces chartreusis TaxID=1969 RepID=UPI00363C0214
MTGRRPTLIPLPAPAPLGTVDDALGNAHAGMQDALAALPVDPPTYLVAPSVLTAHELQDLLRTAALDVPYRVTARGVAGMRPGVYRSDTHGPPPTAVWHGPTAPFAHVLTRGGNAAAAALADAPAVVHLLGNGPKPAAEALRLRIAACGRGLTAWCDDRPAPSAPALLGLAGGEKDVACHITVGRAQPDPRLRVPVPADIRPGPPDPGAPA